MQEVIDNKIRSTIYVDSCIWLEFKSICAREGQKMSFKIEKWIMKYVQDHKKGNPQQRLDILAKTNRPYVAEGKCFWKGCPNPAETTALYVPDDREYKVCLVHLKELRGNKNWRPMGRKLGQ